MLGRSEQGCEESLRGRELLQQEVNRLKVCMLMSVSVSAFL